MDIASASRISDRFAITPGSATRRYRSRGRGTDPVPERDRQTLLVDLAQRRSARVIVSRRRRVFDDRARDVFRLDDGRRTGGRITRYQLPVIQGQGLSKNQMRFNGGSWGELLSLAPSDL